MVDTSAMSRVLKIDTERETALVEPNVPMDRLVEATLQHGLIPPVVMEFPGITVGGVFAGTSGESSSFRYSSFDRSTVNFRALFFELINSHSIEKIKTYYLQIRIF
jgi:delta24-sterol reductase